MTLPVKIIFDDGTSVRFEAHEVVVEDSKVQVSIRAEQLVLAEEDSDQKW